MGKLIQQCIFIIGLIAISVSTLAQINKPFQLRGVIYNPHQPSLSRAILAKPDGSMLSVQPGDTIENSVMVEEIHPDKIIVLKNGQRYSINISAFAPSKKTPKKTPPSLPKKAPNANTSQSKQILRNKLDKKHQNAQKYYTSQPGSSLKKFEEQGGTRQEFFKSLREQRAKQIKKHLGDKKHPRRQ